ncbi:MAG: DRTGG domain-containing protein [Bacilli bacterium]
MKTTLLLNKNFELKNTNFKKEITGVISSDLLSLVMGKGIEGNILVTIQNNLNSIAVASLLELSAIIITYGYNVDEQFLKRAEAEEITVFTTYLSTADVIVKLKEFDLL